MAVVADDFTGACDAGVQFAKRGLATTVSFSGRPFETIKSVQIIVRDTETRNRLPETAYRQVKSFCRICLRFNVELIYKKIDSTLRGNLGAELDAVLDIFKDRIAVISPTYPEYQRTTVGGSLLVKGTPVEKTEFGQGELRSSNLKTIVSSQSKKSVTNISLAIVRRGAASVVQAIRKSCAKGVRIFCVDAVNRADLKNIAAACLRTNALPCGSAGLAEEIAAKVPRSRTRVLMVAASTNEATMREIRSAGAKTKSLLIVASAIHLARKGRYRQQEINRIRRLTSDALESSRDVILTSAISKRDVDVALLSSPDRTYSESRRAIVSGLADAASGFVLSRSVGAVVLTGGEMAAAFMNQIHAQGMILETELLPGIALGIARRGQAKGLKVVTKAGGFALKGSLVQVMRYLHSNEGNTS